MKNKIVLCFLLLLFIEDYSLSQQACPPTDGWNSLTTTFYRDRFMTHYEAWGNVNENFRTNPDGSIDVKINWNTLNNSHKYGITDNEFKGFLYLAIIKDLLVNCSAPTEVNISFYEISDCFVDNPCYLKANQTATIFCKDNLWPGPDPEAILDSQTGLWIWVILNRLNCGIKCCKTTYLVRCATDSYSSPTIIGSPQQTTYFDCPSSNVVDCYFNVPKTCNAPCPLIQELP